MGANLVRRVIVAAIGIPVAFGLVLLGGWVLALLIAVFGAVGSWEIYGLAARTGVRPFPIAGCAAGAAIPLIAYAVMSAGAGLDPTFVLLATAFWIMTTMVLTLTSRGPTERPLAALAVTVFGAVYAGGMPAFLLLLRHGDVMRSAWAATWVVFLPLVLTWVCDSVAMAGGSVIGGRKLAPVLSPNKTWAGAISGSLSALVLAPIFGAVVLAPLGVVIGAWQLAYFGLVISVVGQVGDVAESLMKREAGVKDSGRFFPGHGGVLDRLDSLYWVVPTAVLLLTAFGVL